MLRIISGQWRQRRLKVPLSTMTRPTTDRVREALFNILIHTYDMDFHGLIVADIFAGSGAFGLESLSRGAASCYFIENNPNVLKILKENISTLKAESHSHIVTDELPILNHLRCLGWEKSDLIFLDPPYGKNLAVLTLSALQHDKGLNSKTLIVIESSAKDIPKTIDGLVCDQCRIYGQTALSFWRKS